MIEYIDKILYEIPNHLDYADIPEDLDLEDVPIERISALVELLNHEDKNIQFRAAILATNWGIIEGFTKLNIFLDDEEYLEDDGFSSHRLRNYNEIYEQILSAFIRYQAIGNDNLVEGIKEIVFAPIAKIIEKSNYQPFSIGLLYYSSEEKYTPLFKKHLSLIIIDRKNNYWKIHDVLKKLLQVDKDWVYQFLEKHNLKLKKFGLKDERGFFERLFYSYK